MNIEWIAHSCFKITLDSGKTIVFDPFDDRVGYAFGGTAADIVLVSHGHYDHNCVAKISGEYRCIDKPGQYTVGEIVIQGIGTFHDNKGGAERGLNTAFLVKAEGLSLLHLGDLGHIPGRTFYKEVGQVDILFIPVGGNYTIDAVEALEICKSISPGIIVPMHYKTPGLKVAVAPVSHFIDAAGGSFDITELGGSIFRITSGEVNRHTRIIVMENSMERGTM